MKKLLLTLAVVVVAATSCQKEVAGYVSPQNEDEACTESNMYSVDIEQAIDNLNRELDIIYGYDTRVDNGRPHVRKISTLRHNDIASNTRSVETDADELLYIVEFEEGQGSAILGADSRLEGVFAILDQSVLTPEDFTNARNRQNDDNISTFVAGLIIDEVNHQLATNEQTYSPRYIEVGLRVNYWEYDTIINESAQTLLRTKWGQARHYNDYCFGYNGNEISAGCVPIAAAQLMAYNNYPDHIFINLYGQTFSRNLINYDSYPQNIPTNLEASVKREVARYVGLVADSLINIPYSSSSSINRIPQLLVDAGYSEADVIDCNGTDTFDNEIRQMLYIDKKPTIMEADYDGMESGHTWVIDGYMYNKVNHWWYTKEGIFIISRELKKTVETRKVHCNFGWYGACDGYYTYSIFDVSRRLSDDDIVEEVGDKPSYIENICFQYTPSVLIYNF